MSLVWFLVILAALGGALYGLSRLIVYLKGKGIDVIPPGPKV